MYKVARVIMYPNSKKSWIGGKIGSKKKEKVIFILSAISVSLESVKLFVNLKIRNGSTKILRLNEKTEINLLTVPPPADCSLSFSRRHKLRYTKVH